MRAGRIPLTASVALAVCIALAPLPAFATTVATPSPLGVEASVASALSGDAEQAVPDPEAEAGRLAFVVIPLIGAAVIVVGAIVVISRGRRRRRGD